LDAAAAFGVAACAVTARESATPVGSRSAEERAVPTSSSSTSPIDPYSLASDASLPPFVAGQSQGEPPAHEMAPWIWQYGGSGWTLEVFTPRTPGTDELTTQALFLEAPDGDLFRLHTLRTDFELQIEQWSATPAVAWITRFKGESNWLVALDLVAGTVDEYPMATVEASGSPPPLDLAGSPTSIIWRNPDGSFERSSINTALTPIVEPWGSAMGITLTSHRTMAVT
jgi:hypothetical protein